MITESMEGCHLRKAEIICVVTIGKNDFSNNSAKDIIEAFKTMFPDSHIVSSFQCGADKIKYLTNWGYHYLYKRSVSTQSEQVTMCSS